MWETSSDVLNMSLAIGFIVLVVFLCLFLFYAILILRDVSKVVDDAAEVVGKVRSTIVEPLRAVDFVIERAKPYVDMVLEKRTKARTKTKKK